jgi:diguanylate cyclase (GGDEF)-like protein
LQLDRLISAFTLDRPLPSDLPADDDTVVEEDYRLSNYVATSVPLILSVTAGLIALYLLSDLVLGDVESFLRFLPVMGGTSVILLVLALLVHRSALQRKTSEVGTLGVVAVGTVCMYLAIVQYMQDQSILHSLPYVYLLGAVSVPFWPDRRYFIASGFVGAAPFLVLFLIRPETDLLEYLIPMTIIAAVLLYLVQETISRANRRMFALAYEVQYRASHDVMTTLSSRSHWFALASAVYDQSMRDRRPLCILYLDIDHFKSINDHFGHDVGDTVLKRVAEAVAHNAPRRDLVSRFGGEEFVKLLPDTSLPQAIARARALHQRVNAIEMPSSTVTVSVGIAEAVPGQTLDEMIIRADRAMLRAKESGRNRTVIATADIPPTIEPPPVPAGAPSIMTEDDLATN